MNTKAAELETETNPGQPEEPEQRVEKHKRASGQVNGRFHARASTAADRLATAKPGWADTRIDDALLQAVETLDLVS